MCLLLCRWRRYGIWVFGELFGLSEDCVSWQSSSELTLFGQGKPWGLWGGIRLWLLLRWNAHIYSCIVPALLMAILAWQQDFWLAMVVGTNCFLPGVQNIQKQSPHGNAICWDFRKVLERLWLCWISWSCGLAKASAQTLGSTLFAFVFKGSRRGLQMTAQMRQGKVIDLTGAWYCMMLHDIVSTLHWSLKIWNGCNQLQDGGELQCNFMPPGVPAAVLLALMMLCFVLATVGWTKVAYSKSLPAPKHVLYLSNATWLSLANSIAEKPKGWHVLIFRDTRWILSASWPGTGKPPS